MVVDNERWGLATAQGAHVPPSLRVLRYYAHAYRRTWRSSVTVSFLYPVMYLTAMGLGLGSLINHHIHLVDHVKYLDFIAPGLLAATAMQIATNDSMFPVMAAIKWIRTYFAMLATPLSVDDVLFGHLAWIAVRLTMVGTIYLGVMAAFGVVHSLLAIVALPVTVLIGLAFAAPLSAFSATQENDRPFVMIYRLALIPLFLFSGTFFPIAQLPRLAAGGRVLHAALPRRASVPGPRPRPGAARGRSLGDVAYLLALAVIGTLVARVLLPPQAGRMSDAPEHRRRSPAASSATRRRLGPNALDRPAPRPADPRAQRRRLPARLDVHRLGLLRAVLLPALDRRSASAKLVGTAARGGPSHLLPDVRGARACWPPRP